MRNTTTLRYRCMNTWIMVTREKATREDAISAAYLVLPSVCDVSLDGESFTKLEIIRMHDNLPLVQILARKFEWRE